MLVWFFIYLSIIGGMCYLAIDSELESNFVRGIVLFILYFLELWTIGRIVVNPVNRAWAIAVSVANAVAIITLIVIIIRNKD